MRWLETDTNSNINIATGTSVGAYTADADRLILCEVFLDQAQGSGTYTAWLTHQINGAGSSFLMGPKTQIASVVGETALKWQSGLLVVRTNDVLTVFVDGLANDTTTPDTTVRWSELAALRPMTADRQLNVSATGTVVADSVTGNVNGTVNAVVGGYVTVTGSVVSSSVTNPVTASVVQGGYVTVSGTVDANVVSQDNIDFGALQKASLNAATPASVGSVTNPVTASVVQGGYVSVSGTVTANVSGYVQVTGTVDANMIQVSGDATAADNLETALDGGAYNVGGGAIIAASVTAGVTVTTNNDKTGYGLANGAVTAAVIATGAIDADAIADGAIDAGAIATGAIDADALAADAVTEITDDIFAEAVEGTVTFRQWIRRSAAVLFGKASGGGAAGSKKFRNLADSVDRVDATTTANGDRTSVTFDDS